MAALCPSPELLRALSLGNLTQTESDDLFDHVKRCDECQAELETIHSNDDSFVQQLRGPDELGEFQSEANCQAAVARALGALAHVDRALDNPDHSYLPPRLGEYEIERRLGTGGMGSVYLGRHTKLGREVAIKILAHHRWHDPRVVERFEAEIKAIGRLSHPNIVSAYDAREVDGMAVLITEYVNGYDLGALLKRTGPLDVADACEIIRQTATALEYTHSQGFVHRDVKPSNIMVSRLGHVKLLDLGLARLQFQDDQQPGLTGTGQAIGTADFIAPEQVVDGRSVDARADIYSLGCTLFKLLTGFAPFETKQHATAFAKMTAHVSAPAPSLASVLPTLPTKLLQLVDAMMAKAPTDRPQKLTEVIEVMNQWAQGANLAELVRRADMLVPRGQETHQDLERATSSAARTPETWATRRFPLRVLIATGFLSLGLGFFLGMMITIKYADGTVVNQRVPAGSEVTITHESDASDAATAGQPKKASPFNPATGMMGMPSGAMSSQLSGESRRAEPEREPQSRAETEIKTSPLSFGIIAEGAERDPLSTAFWVDVADRLQAAGTRRQILIESDPPKLIFWHEIYSHVVATSTSTGLSLQFEGPLADRIASLTQDNLGRQLAIVLNGKVVATPKIVSPVRNAAEISGLERHEVEFLLQAVSGLLDVNPNASVQTPETPPLSLPFQLGLLNQSSASEPAKTATALEDLKQLALALQNYEATYQRLPASANVTLDGRSVPHPYSWRVAILPFLGSEESKLFREYDFQQPWDSETNRRLLAKMPAVFESPFAGQEAPGSTHYMGFAGEQGAFGLSEGKTISDFTDGMSNSILIAECDTSVFWTQPTDLPSDSPVGWNGELRAALADGSARVFNRDQIKDIRPWITISGGERMEP